MRHVFFQLGNTNDIAYAAVDDVASLYAGVITPETPKLVYNDSQVNEEISAASEFVQLMTFDDFRAPQNLIVKREAAEEFFIDAIRNVRDEILIYLDSVQLRALSSGKQAAIAAIEEDKVRLRDITKHLSFQNCNTIVDYLRIRPGVLLENYTTKYKPLL